MTDEQRATARAAHGAVRLDAGQIVPREVDLNRAPILDFLRERGPTTAPVIARAIGRKEANVATRLRQYEIQRVVRRTGRMLSEGKGAHAIEWAAVDAEHPPTNGREPMIDPNAAPAVERDEHPLRRAYLEKLIAMLEAGAPEHIFDRVERLIKGDA